MAIEIERKFLLANDGWQDRVTKTLQSADGLAARASSRKVAFDVVGAKRG